MLKTNFDRGRDHLAMFEPFVDDAINSNLVDGATDADVHRWIAEAHQLSIPLATIRTLMSRAQKRGHVRREGGRYFAGTQVSPSGPGLSELRLEVEQRQQRLADDYRAWALEAGTEIPSSEMALRSLIGFIERNHVRLALTDPQGELAGVDVGVRDALNQHADRAAAQYIQKCVRASGPSAEAIGELLEGYVLQNALLLADVTSAARHFSGLRVFFDSGLLFGALGLQGEGSALLTTELIALLIEEGARPEAFSATLREMRRVLAVYESLLGTEAGRRKLHPTPLTRHLLTSQASPSDVNAVSVTLEGRLRDLGIKIVDAPERIERFTLGEADLSSRLASREGGEGDPRVTHDVDCVAAVLTLRKGAQADSLERARAVFVTSSHLTVKNVNLWYYNEGGTGLPPIAHILTISNLTWMKRPARNVALKLEELIALCAAALRPSRAVWSKFQAHLERLTASGALGSDEEVAILASGLTDKLLEEVDIDDDPDAETLTEVVERVKASFASVANARANALEKQVRQLAAQLDSRNVLVARRARRVGVFASWVFVCGAGASFTLGAGTTIFDAVAGRPFERWTVWAGVIPLAVAGLLGVAWGFNLVAWRHNIEQFVTSRLAHWLRAEPDGDGA